MDNRMTRICTICARGGSKGKPEKNTHMLAGKPLVTLSIEQAKISGLFDLVAVSSDSEIILKTADAAGAELSVNRPAKLAADTAGKLPAIHHCLLAAEAALGRECTILVDLDVTSPLRMVEDIHGAVNLLEESTASNVITGMPARRSPYFNIVELNDAGVAHLSKIPDREIVRRQDAPKCYDMNASIYAWRRDIFIDHPAVFYPDTLFFEMPEERSIDIDTDIDLAFIEFLIARRTNSEVK